jgi:hypothetical protein
MRACDAPIDVFARVGSLAVAGMAAAVVVMVVSRLVVSGVCDGS